MTITEQLAAEVADIEKAKKVKWDNLDMKVRHEGREITLPDVPAKMPIKESIKVLQRLQKDEETEVNVVEKIDAYPLDAAVAFVKAMQRLYGWSSPVATPGFFGQTPPTYLAVRVGIGDDDFIQVPIGAFMLPGISYPVNATISRDGKEFFIHGVILQREKRIVQELANETRKIVRAESIYRGRAVRITVDEYGNFGTNVPPEFIDTTKIGEADLVFSADIMEQIDTNILVPIKYTAEVKRRGIPLKRGVLLEGPYGTGKSLTAAMVARVSEDNGWTFILLNRVQGLRQALEFANRFKPAVVFAEDIDRVAVERDEVMNDLINVIDGVVSKRSEIMTILTTNHVEKLNPVILRPGRLDAIVSLKAPDAATVKKLIRHYAGDLLDEQNTLEASGKELEGQIPASIREAVERAKLGMIGRRGKKLVDRDVVIAAQTMKNHLALLNRDTKAKSVAETFAESLHKVVHNGTGETIEHIKGRVDDIYNTVS